MPIVNRIAAFHEEMTAWRRDFHAHPETAFEEVRTSGLVAERLASWGIEVHRGLGRTGVVGILHGRGGPGPMIGLRADMDALHIQEENTGPHVSTVPGKMHACGHDGHTSMLLGAARYLAETRNFSGTVCFIFQPAEENEAGARVMIEDGLFERFPCRTVWAMHNSPDLPAGQMGVLAGPAMAAADLFDIEIHGKGSHAAAPHLGIDSLLIGAQIVTQLQALVARAVDPIEAAVVSVTRFQSGETYNVMPERARLSGTVRTFKPAVQDLIEAGMQRVIDLAARAHGAAARLTYIRRYPALVNPEAETAFASKVAADIVGEANVQVRRPVMGAEDFAFMLNARPGSYIWVGQKGGPSDAMVHHPRYDFNDAILPLGASWFARIVETALPRP